MLRRSWSDGARRGWERRGRTGASASCRSQRFVSGSLGRPRLDDRDAASPACEADLGKELVDVAPRSDRGDEDVVAGPEEDRASVSGAHSVGAI